METIILASASPRRKEILSRLDLPFQVMPVHLDERLLPGEEAPDAVLRLAREKVESLIQQFGRKAFPWVVGADTLVQVGGTPLGKPANSQEARQMLESLSGRAHSVVTGVALYNRRTERISVSRAETEVVFADLSPDEISWYIDTQEWQGAAGAYRIQERGACLVDRIIGSYSNVMGLPIRTFYGMLREHIYPFS